MNLYFVMGLGFMRVEKNKNKNLHIIIIIFITILTLNFAYWHMRYINQTIYDDAVGQIAIETNRNGKYVRNCFYSDLNNLKVLAYTFELEDANDLKLNKNFELMNYFAKQNNYTCLVIKTIDGNIYTSENADFYYENEELFHAYMNGEIKISQPLTDKITGSKFITFNVPIFAGENLIGVLSGAKYAEEIREILADGFYQDRGSTYLINKNGEILLASEHSKYNGEHNIYQVIKNETADTINTNKMNDDLYQGREGYAAYNVFLTDRTKIISYVPVRWLNDWYVVSSVGDFNDFSNTQTLIRSLRKFFLIIIFVLILSFTVFINNRNKDKKILQESYAVLEYERERYSIIMNQSDDILFEYSFEDDNLYVSPKWKEKFQYELPNDRALERLAVSDIIYRGDLILLEEMLMDAYRGIGFSKIEIRALNERKEYIWLEISTSTIFNETKVPIKAIGKIVDIDHRKREKEKLIEKAQLDCFTKAYNKAAVQSMIEQVLSSQPEELHAFIIIDIDNFKRINDSLGHSAGDEVLLNFSDRIQALFTPEEAILGRIGGDEFVLLLKAVKDSDDAAKRANQVCDLFRNIKITGYDTYKVSCSMGVALYPKTGTTYHELYKKADCALYEIKRKSKNDFLIYSE